MGYVGRERRLPRREVIVGSLLGRCVDTGNLCLTTLTTLSRG